MPCLIDLSDFAAAADGVARIVLESVQQLLLKLALQMERDDYETRRERQRQGVQLAKAAGKYAGRRVDTTTHQRIVALRGASQPIKRTAELARCSKSQVQGIWAIRYGRCGHNGHELRYAAAETVRAIIRDWIRRRLSAPKRIGFPLLPDRVQFRARLRRGGLAARRRDGQILSGRVIKGHHRKRNIEYAKRYEDQPP